MFINPRTNAQASILGFYKYDDKLFDQLTFPTGIDKNLAVNLILQETANLESFYTNWDYLNFAIGLWGQEMFWTFDKMYQTLNFDYNPIWNKDGIITEERKIDETTTNENMRTAATQGETESNTQRENQNRVAENNESMHAGAANGETTGDNTTENGIAGFNSANYVDDTKQHAESTGTSKTADTSTDTATKTANSIDTGTETDRNHHRTAETSTDNGTGTRGVNEAYRRVEQGNIGLTSTQQLIEEERRVAMFSLYKFIVDSFKRHFCIMVY